MKNPSIKKTMKYSLMQHSPEFRHTINVSVIAIINWYNFIYI